MQCTNCNSQSAYTSYIRSKRRSAITHQSRQVWIPVGIICVECDAFQNTMEPNEKLACLNRLANKTDQKAYKRPEWLG